MKYSLKAKLWISHVAIALICIGLISLVLNVFMERQFKEYVIKNTEQKSNEIVSRIERQYFLSTSQNPEIIESIGADALKQGLIIRVEDANNNLLWDAREYNHGMCEQIIENMSENMTSKYHDWQGSYVEKSYSIVSGSQNVGTVKIGYYGPFYFDDRDLAFINNLNKALVYVGLFSLALAFIFGTVISGRLTRPISRVINTARMISKGEFKHRSLEKSNTKEIKELIETVNNMAETLEKQENLRRRLTADMAHELRTPLSILQVHMEGIIDGVWAADNERMNACYDEIMRIQRMVGDIEKLSRVEGENILLNKAEFDLSALMMQMIKKFEYEQINKGIEIVYEGGEVTINADKDKISQAILNLLSNAIRHIGEGGRIVMTAEEISDKVIISIRDNGSGISEEDRPFIFERLYRADKSRNKETGGRGLGLAITKAIIIAHKGTIDVESKLNEGSVFTIVLPKQ